MRSGWRPCVHYNGVGRGIVYTIDIYIHCVYSVYIIMRRRVVYVQNIRINRIYSE